MHLTRPCIALAALLVTLFTGAGVASAGVPGPCRAIVGELQHVTVNVHPPCELDVSMWNGNLNGQSVGIRCADMGGQRLGTERFQGQTIVVCYAVDY